MTLYVGNLSFNLQKEELENIFANFGEVLSVKIIIDRETGRSKGFAFVEMANQSEGNLAIQEMNGTLVGGRNLKVNEAQPRN